MEPISLILGGERGETLDFLWNVVFAMGMCTAERLDVHRLLKVFYRVGFLFRCRSSGITKIALLGSVPKDQTVPHRIQLYK